MKSVFFVVGLCYMLGLLTAVIVGTDFAFFILVAVCFAAVLCSVVYKKNNKKALLTGLMCAAAGILFYSVAYNVNVLPVAVLDNQNGSIVADVTEDVRASNGKYTYYLETNKISLNDSSIENVPQNIKLRITTRQDLGLRLNDIVKLNVAFTEKGKSPYTNHDYSNGYYINASLSDNNITVYPQRTVTWYSLINNFHNSVKEHISKYLNNNQTALLMSLLLGNKSELKSNIQDNFRSAGLSHILVVSGLHLTIIVNFIFGFLSMLIKNKKIPAGITIGFIIVYVILTGGTYSIMRASVMSILYLLSFFVMKKANALNNIGIAGIVITVANPLSIGNLSLLMSFGATLGICTLGSRMNKWFVSKLPELSGNIIKKTSRFIILYIVENISVSISATLFTLPVMVFVFEQFSVYFIVSNLLINFIAPFTIVGGIVMVILCYIPFAEFLLQAVGFVEGVLCNYILGVSSFVADLPFSTVRLGSSFVKLSMVAVIVVIVLFFVAQGFKIKNTVVCSVVCTSVALMILMSKYAIMTQAVCFEIVKTGNGITIIQSGNDGTNVICCGGNISYNENVMQNIEGERVNSVLVPDRYGYYSKYAEDLLSEFGVDNVLAYNSSKYSEIFRYVLEEKNCKYIDYNTTVDYGRYTVKIIPVEDRNWVYIECQNSNILISPQNADCANLPEQYRNSNVAILQKNCENINLLNSQNTVFCGKDNDKNFDFCTNDGNVILFQLSDGGFNVWQK